jgi:hypothetical protein
MALMTDVLVMIACEFGHPVAEFILMETNDAPFHSGLRCDPNSSSHTLQCFFCLSSWRFCKALHCGYPIH